MLRHYGDIRHLELCQVVVEEKQVRVVTLRNPFGHRPECTVHHLATEAALLTLELELLTTNRAKEVGRGTVCGKTINLGVAAVGAIDPPADPFLGPSACPLRSAVVGRLFLFEAEVHMAR